MAFHKGSKDTRDSLALLSDIILAAEECKGSFLEGNPQSIWLTEFSECEERLASMLRDVMLLAARQGWDIPEAMACRNTLLRNEWREKT